MRVNIEPLKKKESIDFIDFDFTITHDELSEEQIKSIGAERIESIRVCGSIGRKDGGNNSVASVMPIIAINYTIEANFTAVCARCNEIVPQEICVDGEKFIADRIDGDDEYKEDDENFYMIDSGIIELVDFAMEFLDLEAPVRYLCSEDCKGLCSKCGKNLNEGVCGCPTKEKNPSFKILDNFFD